MGKSGYSSPGSFENMNHYDANGKKIDGSHPSFFGGLNHYED